MLIHQMLMLRSTRGLRSSTHSEEQGSSGEPSIIHHDTSKWAVTPKTFPFPLVIYFSNLKKIGVRSDVCNMIVIFIGLVIPIPNSCSLSLSFFLNLFYRAASHRLNLVKVCLKGPWGTNFMSPFILFCAIAIRSSSAWLSTESSP